MEARIWAPQSLQYEGLKSEQFTAVSGQVVSFKDQLQMNIVELMLVSPTEMRLDMADFLPASSVPASQLLEEIEELLAKELSFRPWHKLCKKVLRDPRIRGDLLTAPGAKAIHHAYAGGLLEHTLGVMRVCLALSDLYPFVDKEILLVAALFHDLGKAFELTHGFSREYTDAGRLIGHIQMGLEVLEQHLRAAKNIPEGLVLHLKHLILSHHGELEFGSPRRPKTVEAFILHYADNLDAKINTINTALENTGDPEDVEADHWSEYHRTLGRYLYQPMRTPKTDPADTPKTLQKAAITEQPPLLKLMGGTLPEG
jgi:3'-5' exoribonuclease